MKTKIIVLNEELKPLDGLITLDTIVFADKCMRQYKHYFI